MIVKPAPDELFFLPAPERWIDTEPMAGDSAFSAIFEWRDQMYKKHRGEPVRP